MCHTSPWPTRIPVLFLALVAAVPSGLALRANFEVLQLAQNLTTFVETMIRPLQRFFAKPVEFID
jgi:cell shape-determining protein MreC